MKITQILDYHQMAHNRIKRDLAELQRHYKVSQGDNDRNDMTWLVTIEGPEGSYYEGRTFEIEVKFSYDHPFVAPSLTFKTKIFHPNVFKNGHVTMSMLRPSAYTTISDILKELMRLMQYPDSDEPGT